MDDKIKKLPPTVKRPATLGRDNLIRIAPTEQKIVATMPPTVSRDYISRQPLPVVRPVGSAGLGAPLDSYMSDETGQATVNYPTGYQPAVDVAAQPIPPVVSRRQVIDNRRAKAEADQESFNKPIERTNSRWRSGLQAGVEGLAEAFSMRNGLVKSWGEFGARAAYGAGAGVGGAVNDKWDETRQRGIDIDKNKADLKDINTLEDRYYESAEKDSRIQDRAADNTRADTALDAKIDNDLMKIQQRDDFDAWRKLDGTRRTDSVESYNAWRMENGDRTALSKADYQKFQREAKLAELKLRSRGLDIQDRRITSSENIRREGYDRADARQGRTIAAADNRAFKTVDAKVYQDSRKAAIAHFTKLAKTPTAEEVDEFLISTYGYLPKLK